MTYKISYDPNPSQSDLQILDDGIQAYANQHKALRPVEPFAFFLRDETNKIIGGISGEMYCGCLYIGHIWVDEALRGKGYGSQLMHAAETLGVDRGCTFVSLNSFDWESLNFYKKLRYEVEFERHGFSDQSIFYFLRKNLNR